VSEIDDMAEFMEERLNEDEAAAEAASSGHPNPESRGGTWQVVGDRRIRYNNGCGETVTAVDVTGGPCMWHEQIRVTNDLDHAVSGHVARYDPNRARREVAAKRARLALMTEAHAEMGRLLADQHAGDVDRAMAIGRARGATVAVKHDVAAWRSTRTTRRNGRRERD
jgi:hypothetical protein